MTPDQIEAFVADGFVRLDGAFAPEVAAACRARLARDLGCDVEDPATWNEPVVRLGMYADPPFLAATRTPALRDAFDALVGATRWVPPGAVGTFPVRFPSRVDPVDTGWHVDASFGTDAPDFLDWRVEVTSRGRALLVLMLFSDVGDDDAPTRIRVGSHRDLPRLLVPAGDAGLTLRELVARDFGVDPARAIAHATGPAGTAYLCHPFLVHAAQPHRGTRPRFLAQPPLLPREPLRLDGPSPVERAIREALRG